MKKILIMRYLLFAAIFSLVGFASCNEEDDLGTPDRLFRPVVKETIIGITWINLKWDRYEGAESYELQLSVDSFLTIARETSTDLTDYTFEDLGYDTQYQIRIRSLGDKIMSDYIQYTYSTLKWPTKLKTPTTSDYVDTQIRVRWAEADYDRLDICTGKTDIEKTVNLTPEDNMVNENNEKSIIIKELEPSTAYIIKAYSEDEFMGEVAYNTLSPQIIEGDYIDLRSLSETDAYSALSQTNFNTWAAQYPNGFTVVLSGGTHYQISTVNLSASLRLVTGLSLAGNAVMEDNGSFAVNADANLDYVIFDNIIITEHPSSPRDAGNYGGRYVFNFNNAGAKINELSLLNCDIRYKRGVIRAQVATLINKILVENCLMDSIGGYGITNADHAESYFTNVIIKNSTIAHSEKFAVASKPTVPPNSLVLENLTVCYTPKGDGNYIIDYNSQSMPGGLTIKNCIFGAGWDSKVRGMRSSTTNITVQDSYMTNDLEWTLNTSNEPQNPIDALEVLNGTTTGIFADPQNVNFKVTHPTLAKRIGDPRWW
ncbi:MAG: DUF5123 domain-containing protein [Candidatus Symbiothrix sp.]|nr:DUF5123 domain-containing protein [Candidatus Symbiothrix sp.]